jgi:hypothetical protein
MFTYTPSINGDVPPIFVVYPAVPTILTIDFGGIFAAGDYLASGAWTFSSADMTLTSSTPTSSTAASVNIFANTMQRGETAFGHYVATSVAGKEESRTIKFLCEYV